MGEPGIIWTDLTRKAFEIASKAHAGQLDRGGVPYIFHPLHLAEEMTNPIAQAAALLHDVPENTSVTIEDLRMEGIPEEVVRAVELLTHAPSDGLTYMEYIRRLKTDSVAVEVKLADLGHNMDLTRLYRAFEKQDFERNARYRKAVAVLQEERS